MASDDVKHKLVVAAIDFGTTYSGFAYCTRYEYDRYQKNSDDQPKIICPTWNTGAWMNYKAPTCVLFDDKKKFRKFGYEAQTYFKENPDKHDMTKWYYFEHFKMMLYDEKDELSKDTMIRETIDSKKVGKTMKAVDVFAAVIKFFKESILNRLLDGHGGKAFSDKDIHWVLTVPAIWDLKAKQFMRDAAELADITSDQLILALEPEAASIHCRRQPIGITQDGGKKEIAAMKKGDKYVVFDQGGGTTDITVHEVMGPDTVKEIHQACGGHWGGITVNGEFYKFLVRLFGGDVINAVKENHPVEYFELMHNFEHAKTSFKNDSDKVTIRMPMAWLQKYEEFTEETLKDVLPQTNFNRKIILVSDKLRIKSEYFRTFFDFSINHVLDELSSLFQKRELRGVQTLLAVGGFSESSVLIDAIREKLGSEVDVIVPSDPGLAVLKGAVMYGFEPGTIISRVSRYTYGVAMQRNYIDGVDDQSKKPRRGTLIDDVFDIHVRKGQAVDIGQFEPEHRYVPTVDEQRCAHFEFFATEDTEPKYTTESGCSLIGVLSVDLNRKKSKDGDLFLKINASGTEIVAVVREKATDNEYRAYFSLF